MRTQKRSAQLLPCGLDCPRTRAKLLCRAPFTRLAPSRFCPNQYVLDLTAPQAICCHVFCMGWIEKGEPSPFDQQPISGLFFLDGDLLAREFKQDWTKGQKFPTIVFP